MLFRSVLIDPLQTMNSMVLVQGLPDQPSPYCPSDGVIEESQDGISFRGAGRNGELCFLIVINSDRLGIYNVSICTMLLINQLLNGIGRGNPVIGIDPENEGTSTSFNGQVPTCGKSYVMAVPDDPERIFAHWIIAQRFLENEITVVGRGVVDEQILNVRVCLLQDTSSTSLNERFRLVKRNQDADSHSDKLHLWIDVFGSIILEIPVILSRGKNLGRIASDNGPFRALDSSRDQ